jgi:hypothetical protein
MVTIYCCERGLPVFDGASAETLTLEIQARQFKDGGFVVNEEDEFVQVGGLGNSEQ